MDETSKKIFYSNLKSIIVEKDFKNDSRGEPSSNKNDNRVLETGIDEFCDWAVAAFEGDESLRGEIRKALEPLLVGTHNGSLLQVACRLQRIEVCSLFLSY